MPKRMSCALTTEAVRFRMKDVTRRRVDAWKNLKAGEELTLVEKGMGLKPGEKQVVLCTVKVVDVRTESIEQIAGEHLGCTREGFPEMQPDEFVTMWKENHGYKPEDSGVLCRRIEWEYLAGAAYPSMEFLLQNCNSFVGNSPTFWKEGGGGYTPWITEAKRWYWDQARRQIRATRGSHSWKLWSVEQVERVARLTVDIQDLNRSG